MFPIKSLWKVDAISLMERIETSTASLVYVDPPFGIHLDEKSRSQLYTLQLHVACHSKRILNDKGVVVWHILPENSSDVRRILDRVFGSSLFATEIVLKRPRRLNVVNTPSTDHTSLIVYSKTGEFYYQSPIRPVGHESLKSYSKSDDRGPYRLLDITTGINRPNLQFPWHDRTPPAGRSWKFSLTKLEELHTEGRILIEGRLPMLKSYLAEHAGEEIGSVWDDIVLTRAERSPIAAIGQQSSQLMERIVGMFTQAGDIVVDPFCGTGTTLVVSEHAGRDWIAADNSEVACQETIRRLKERGVECPIFGDEEARQYHAKATIADLLRALSPQQDFTSTDIHHLLGCTESKNLEFKQTLSLDVKKNEKQGYMETEVIKTIAAFLNTDGGTLLVGIRDEDREIVGLEEEIKRFHRGLDDKFLLHFKNLLKHQIGEEFYPLIDHDILVVDGRKLLRVDCRRSDRPCFAGKDEDFYVRTNPATDRIVGKTLLEYVVRRFPNYGI